VNEEDTRSDAARAVQSIPAYVEAWSNLGESWRWVDGLFILAMYGEMYEADKDWDYWAMNGYILKNGNHLLRIMKTLKTLLML